MIKSQARQPLISPLIIFTVLTILFAQSSLASGMLATLSETSQAQYQQSHQDHGHDVTDTRNDHLSLQNLQQLHDGTASTLSQLFLNPARLCCPETGPSVPAEYSQTNYIPPHIPPDNPPPRKSIVIT
ncbi:hypothetical protein [Aliamphritea spongicola]|uniref:hypothetical protein n=1 Tax=Aliamphritea spongicola TaxID=707589 RepID=UPI00196A996B|nr:hypothetical protein [Aliamphritea spongicola]MBN3562712.1 hypothetical protein [Aliamphritea spongicola]